MKARDVAILQGVAGHALVAPNDLLGLPRIGIDQEEQVAGRLVHVQPECVINVGPSHESHTIESGESGSRGGRVVSRPVRTESMSLSFVDI
jgi:hypothetical protein